MIRTNCGIFNITHTVRHDTAEFRSNEKADPSTSLRIESVKKDEKDVKDEKKDEKENELKKSG